MENIQEELKAIPVFLINKKIYNGFMKNKDLTTLAMLIAITVLLGIVPNIGIIQIGVVSLTILHIPVIIASLLLGVKGGFITGLCFGLTSLYVASTRAVSPVDLLFVNPLISVVPRLLFGLISGLIGELLKKNTKDVINGLYGFVSTIIHTVLVYASLFIWAKNDLGTNFSEYNIVKYILTAFSINAFIEAIVAGVITVILMKSYRRLRKH